VQSAKTKRLSAKSFEMNQFLLGNSGILPGNNPQKIKLVIEKMFHDCSTGGAAGGLRNIFQKIIYFFGAIQYHFGGRSR
jgi:hypothetical protein